MAGDPGIPGAKGRKGAHGNNGPKGAKGDKGITGLPGDSGYCQCYQVITSFVLNNRVDNANHVASCDCSEGEKCFSSDSL